MRGIRGRNGTKGLLDRIIPACAGNTLVWYFKIKYAKDHPRLCGEYCKQHVGQLKMLGSSPLVRGIHLLNFRTKNLKRIIPACAGNTSKGKKQCYIQRDHPRLCGEYFNRAFQNVNVQGSSPLVRGIRHYPPYKPLVHRIIPACAGNTLKKAWFSLAFPFYYNTFHLTWTVNDFIFAVFSHTLEKVTCNHQVHYVFALPIQN